jgi:hypothetical protein
MNAPGSRQLTTPDIPGLDPLWTDSLTHANIPSLWNQRLPRPLTGTKQPDTDGRRNRSLSRYQTVDGSYQKFYFVEENFLKIEHFFVKMKKIQLAAGGLIFTQLEESDDFAGLQVTAC